MRKYKSDTGASEPFVGIPWSMMDSAAWKSLSTDATWVFIQMKRHWHSGRFILPFDDVRWKMGFSTFSRARKELIDRGFIVVLEQHYRDGKANVYGPSEKWKKASWELLDDRTAGKTVRRVRRVNGIPKLVPEWQPLKPQSEKRAKAQRANWKRAVEARFGITVISPKKRQTKKQRGEEALEKHSYRIHQLVNGNQPPAVHQVVNNSGVPRSPIGKRPIHQLVNGNGTSIPDETGHEPPKKLKKLNLPAAFAVKGKLKAGQTREEIIADLLAGGWDPDSVVWPEAS